ncbi:MAG: Integrase [uncultured Thermomicrobiales bacterium]|uniref:Integrase n=1 Tax=uncultured Thermomicrobiales bacterium TaxID=1645740 RepID=A0A6J4V8D7_9BACT|nr:MAG: Integrase [uncultured Thermomicrobiales bacterium]
MPVAVERQTVAQFLDNWLETVVKQNTRPRTYDSYAQVTRLYLTPAIGRHQLAKLEPQHVQGMMNALLKEGGKGGTGLSARTVAYTRAILRKALNQVVKWGQVPRNVATLVDPPKTKRHQIAPLTPDQGRALLAVVQGHRLEGLYRVALSLGLRMGETLGLRWEDVDLDTGTLRVAVALQRRKGSRELVEPKTHQGRRTLSLSSVLLAALRAHRTRQLEERLAAGPTWKDQGLVFPSTVGTAIEPRNLTRHFKGVLQAAGLPNIRFHDLRHAAASLLVAQGVHPRVVMEILGHSQISLTMNTYAHVLPETQREAAGFMDILFPASRLAVN